MRRMLICAVLCAIVAALAVSGASAYSSYATATCKPCGYCHVDPGGGGTLTADGEYFLANGKLPPANSATPSGLVCTAALSSQINLTWTDNANNEAGFRVERSSSSNGTYTLLSTVGPGVTSYSNTGLTASTTYYYRVCAYNNTTGNSCYVKASATTTGAPPPPPAAPAAPTGLVATASSQSQINLTWTDNATTETGYRVERAASAGGTFASIATLAAGATSYSNTGLTASTTYYYRVCAFNAGGDSAFATASATTQAPPVTIPAAPTGLSATATSSSQINLSWTDNSGNETGFRVERAATSGGTYSLLTTVGAGVTTYSNTGLTASTAYYYRVCATNSAGNSAYATASATTQAPPVTIPAAPTGLSATATSSSQINLSWTDNSGNETGFRVERAATSGGTYSLLTTVGAGVTTYSNTGLTASTAYYYRVCATNSAGNSGYATASATTQAPAVTIPAAPTGLSATATSSSQINLSWTDNSGNETGFKVERAATSGGTYSLLTTVGAGVTTYSNTGLAASTAYYYRVCATNSAGDSGYATASATTQAPAVTIPAAPTGLSATATSSSQINLSWTDNSGNETGFKVERAATSGGTYSLLTTVGAGVTTYSNTGLTASTAYYYRVCATNSAGNSGYASASATTQAAPPPPATVPAAPTGLTATAASASQINLSWLDVSTNETGYKVERAATATGTYSLIATLGAGATSYSNTGLAASTTYYYHVYAYNTAGNSGYASASATTQASAPTTPAAPTALTATAGSSTIINLAWADNSTNETGFRVKRSSSAAGTYTVIATLGAGMKTYSNTGLTASTSYYYQVCAYNSAGESGYANASATTSAGTSSRVPASPSNLTATVASSTRINLRWTDNSSNESGFKIERATVASGPFAVIATVGAGVTYYGSTGLTGSKTYYYRVRAYNGYGYSGYTNTASGKTAPPGTPAAPKDLTATAVSPSRVDLKWTDASGIETGYKIERATSENGPFTFIMNLGPNATSYSNTELNESTTYFYRVFAYNTAGVSPYSNTASATTPSYTGGRYDGGEVDSRDAAEIAD